MDDRSQAVPNTILPAYEAMFDLHPDPCFLLDADGIIRRLNQASRHMFLRQYRALKGSRFDRFFADAELKKAREHFEYALRGQGGYVDTRIMRSNGIPVDLFITLIPLPEETGEVRYMVACCRNVTLHKKLELSRKESEERYRSLLQLSPDPILVYADGKIRFYNEACARTLGFPNLGSYIGYSVFPFIHPDSMAIVQERIRYLNEQRGRAPAAELQFVCVDGRVIDVESTSAYVTMNGQAAIQVVFRDITERKRLERTVQEAYQQLKQLSQLDGLTGVSNRRAFDEALDRFLAKEAEEPGGFGLMLFDIDYFKKYNDRYGHLQGDDCLKLIADTLNRTLEAAGASLFRYGGEEFAVLLPERDERACLAMAHDVLRQVSALRIPHEASSCSRVVTVSIGLCTVAGRDLPQARELIAAADEALYRAKRSGRNGVECRSIGDGSKPWRTISQQE